MIDVPLVVLGHPSSDKTETYMDGRLLTFEERLNVRINLAYEAKYAESLPQVERDKRIDYLSHINDNLHDARTNAPVGTWTVE